MEDDKIKDRVRDSVNEDDVDTTGFRHEINQDDDAKDDEIMESEDPEG